MITFVLSLMISAYCLALPATAQDGRITKIGSASYDVSDSVVSSPSEQKCEPLDVTKIISQLCLGKLTCRIPIANQTFNKDPCDGKDKTLRVNYECSTSKDLAIAAQCDEYEYMTLMCPPAGFRYDSVKICTHDSALDKPFPK